METVWTLFPLGMNDAWLLPGLTLLSFLLIVFFGRYLPGKGSSVSIAAIGLGFILFWFILGDLLSDEPLNQSVTWLDIPLAPDGSSAGFTLNLGMIVDNISVLMLGVVTFVALCVQVYSIGYMRGDSRYGWYFAAHSLFTASMLGLILADNFLVLYIAWELVGLCSYLLIGFWWERRSAAEAAKKAFITTRIGDVGLLVGILILFKEVGTFQMSVIFEAAQTGAIDQGILTLAAILIFAGAMGKSAQFPFHVWLPDAMEGPTPVSALIHAATMVAAGVYLVARTYPLFLAAPAAMQLVAIIGLITTLIAGSMALVMVDIKRVLAYSTISQLGFMMVALGSFGYMAGIFHLMTHAFFKAMLFLGAGSVLHATEKMEFTELGGLWRKMPITAFTFLIGALAMAGVPLFSGFFSKDEILVAVRDNQNMLFYALVVVAAFMSALYMARLTFSTFFGKPRNQQVFDHAHESPWTMAVPLILLSVLSIISGYVVFDWFGPLFGLSQEYAGVGTYLIPPGGHAEHYHAHYDLMISSTVVALAGLGIGAALYWQRIWSVDPLRKRLGWLHTLLVNKYYMDEIYQWLIDRGVLVVAEFVGFFDRVVINDTGINSVGKGTILSGLGLRYHETGKLYNYGLVMIAGVVTIVVAAVTLMV